MHRRLGVVSALVVVVACTGGGGAGADGGGGSGGAATGGGTGGGAADAGPTSTATFTLKATIPLAGFPQVLTHNAGTHKAYFGCITRDNTGSVSSAGISVVDDATNAVLKTVATSSVVSAMASNGTTKKVYFGAGYRSVDVLDSTTDIVKATSISLGGGNQVSGIAVDEAHNKIYVLSVVWSTSSGRIDVIDGSTDAVTATWTVGVEPLGADILYGDHSIAVDPATQKVFVLGGTTTFKSATVTIDGATGTVGSPVEYTSYGIGQGSTIEVIGQGNAVATLIGGTPNAVQLVDPITVKLPADFRPTSVYVRDEWTAFIFGFDAQGQPAVVAVIEDKPSSFIGIPMRLTGQGSLESNKDVLGAIVYATPLSAGGSFYITAWPDPVSGGPIGPSEAKRVEIVVTN